MKIAFFDTHNYEKQYFEEFNSSFNFEFTWFETRLTHETAHLAESHPIVCSFIEDRVDEKAIGILKSLGVKMLALRSAGYNHVDIDAAHVAHIEVVRVPFYSPYAVAEHAVGLLLSLNRKIHRSYQRVRELNFSLEGLVGFDLHHKKVGVVGTGKIGSVFCKIMMGFGAEVIAYDLNNSPELEKMGVQYVDLDRLWRESDVISLHVPLVPETKHMINSNSLKQMKPGVFLINTSRGALIDSKSLIEGLKSNKIGAAGLDVYEEEEGVFFHDLSHQILQDDVLARLLTFPNVIVTSHQAFLTKEALENIAQVTLGNFHSFVLGKKSGNELYI